LLVWPGALNDVETVVEYGVVEGAMIRAQIVSALRRFMAREDSLLSPVPPGNVDASTLDEMTRKADPGGFGIERGSGEFLVKQAQQAVEGRFVAAARRRGQQN
jgi:hypothetical protein